MQNENYSIVKAGSYYKLPVFKIDESGLIKTNDNVEIKFVKGNKADANTFRQEGIQMEDLLSMALHNLTALNENLPNEFTSRAIEHLRSACMELANRTKDREDRGVNASYEK